jgi:hypothetical protein
MGSILKDYKTCLVHAEMHIPAVPFCLNVTFTRLYSSRVSQDWFNIMDINGEHDVYIQ